MQPNRTSHITNSLWITSLSKAMLGVLSVKPFHHVFHLGIVMSVYDGLEIVKLCETYRHY